MDEAARLLTLLAIVGGALTMVGAAFAYVLDETRRVEKTLTQGLGVPPQPMLTARGRGTGVGFDLAAGRMCVTWDRGGWRLDYRLEELVGVELVVDDRIAARAFRHEPRRGLDQLAPPAELVRLRFIFDDPRNPDFEVDLWRPEDDGRKGRFEGPEALKEANRWMASMEAVLRRSAPKAAAAPAPAAAPAQRQASAPPPAPLFDLEDDDLDDPPWDDDGEMRATPP
ncbi:MAG: hypothetical protein AB1942_13930 [Pseudomonadota bacterium]